MDLYAFCTYAEDAKDIITDNVHLYHTYKVNRFVDDDYCFPFGVIIEDKNGNELTKYAQLQKI